MENFLTDERIEWVVVNLQDWILAILISGVFFGFVSYFIGWTYSLSVPGSPKGGW